MEKGKQRFELELLRIALENNYDSTPMSIREALRKLLFAFEGMVKEEIEEHSLKPSLNSSFIQDCEMLIGYKSLKERQDRLNELKKKWQS